MQALNALPAAVVEPPLVDVAPGVVVVGLFPHAARTMAATETTAAIFIDERKALSLCECTKPVKCTKRCNFS
jgi:hypothetical protein